MSGEINTRKKKKKGGGGGKKSTTDELLSQDSPKMEISFKRQKSAEGPGAVNSSPKSGGTAKVPNVANVPGKSGASLCKRITYILILGLLTTVCVGGVYSVYVDPSITDRFTSIEKLEDLKLFPAGYEAIMPNFQGLPNINSESLESLSESAKDVFNRAQDCFLSALDQLSEVLGDLPRALSKMADEFSKNAGNMLAQLVDTIQITFAGLADLIPSSPPATAPEPSTFGDAKPPAKDKSTADIPAEAPRVIAKQAEVKTEPKAGLGNSGQPTNDRLTSSLGGQNAQDSSSIVVKPNVAADPKASAQGQRGDMSPAEADSQGQAVKPARPPQDQAVPTGSKPAQQPQDQKKVPNPSASGVNEKIREEL